MKRIGFWTGTWVTLAVATSFLACSLVATRPVQLMSDASGAIRAAHEVQADTVAPELYRQATEWFFKAKQEYKLKNFKQAIDFATRAKHFAEQAEFQAIRGGSRAAEAPPPPEEQQATPYAYPTPTGTPADAFEKRKAAESGAQQPSAPQAPTQPPQK